MKKLAVTFPGIGYHKDKPLLYYATKLVQSAGYEVIEIEYRDMPQKIRGNAQMMREAAMLALTQAEEQLAKVDFAGYETVLFVGKSIGTVVAAKFGADHGIEAKEIWYTPVEATFSFGVKDAVAFIGDEDPWSDVVKVKRMAKEQGIALWSYAGCNHSLECGDVDRDIEILGDVMKKSAERI